MFVQAASRRSWITAEARASTLRTIARPSLGGVFLRGFMSGKMLRMAVCSPPRSAETEAAHQKYAAACLSGLGAKVPAAEAL